MQDFSKGIRLEELNVLLKLTVMVHPLVLTLAEASNLHNGDMIVIMENNSK